MMTHDEFVTELLADPEVKAEYDALEPEFTLLRSILKARREAGLTQEQVAERMGTKRTAVVRLESSLGNGKHSPSVATLRKYAAALNHRLEIRFVEA